MKHKLLWMTLALAATISVATSAGILLGMAPDNGDRPLLSIFSPLSATPKAKATTGNSTKVRKVKMTVTAYCPCPICCGVYARGPLSQRRLADGSPLAPLLRDLTGFVAGPAGMPFGTQISIPGYHDGQYVELMDRGKAVVGNRLDVFMPSHKQALQWGVRTLTVTVRQQRSQ